jgi:uracil-DNA glycosylase
MTDQKLFDRFKFLLGEEWFDTLKDYFKTNGFQNLKSVLSEERERYIIYPEAGSDLLFKAFRTTPFSKVKVVILGQDPYHDPGRFDGFAFSNSRNHLIHKSLSPSLRNILSEVENDAYKGFDYDSDPDLQRWAEQGVLLINTAHTVRKGEPGSHLELWKGFTHKVITSLLDKANPIVWMLWGRKAKDHIENKMIKNNHLFLKSPHPSPYSASSGFFGCKHFSECNNFLKNRNVTSIIW